MPTESSLPSRVVRSKAVYAVALCLVGAGWWASERYELTDPSTAVTPTLTVGPVPSVQYAEAFPVDRLLGPTTLGAASDKLCAWATGEAVSDATIGKWLMDGLLAWRVIDVETGTIAGGPLSTGAAGSLTEARKAVDTRCGSTLPPDALMVAGASVPFSKIADALGAIYSQGIDSVVLAVSGQAVPVADSAGSTATSGVFLQVVLENPMKVYTGLDKPGALEGSWEVALRDARCVLVVAPKTAPWGATVAVIENSRAAGVPFVLTLNYDSPPGPDPGVNGPPLIVPLHGELPVLKLPVSFGSSSPESNPCWIEPALGAKDGGIAVAGDPAVIYGSLDEGLIDAVIKRNLSQIRYCYQRELVKNPTLGGEVLVEFVIEKDGTVSSASTQAMTMNNSEVENCINGRFMRLQFPEPADGGSVRLLYPFTFAPL